MKYILLTLITAACISSAFAATDESLPLIDLNTHALFYKLGGGAVVPPPGSGYVTHKVTAHFKGGFNYSCGQFDFQTNLTQMINDIETKAREIPLQLQAAASAAVAGLPGYLMQKVNPNLYNILTKTLDETAELFRLSYKTCESMEAEMRANPGSNPYSGFMRVSIANKWSDGAESGDNIADVKTAAQTDPTGPITWIGGKDYGTADNPIQLNHDLVMAGYNIMLGRDGDVSIDTAPTGSLALTPIAKIWPKPSDAGKWLQNVVGDREIVTDDKDQIPVAKTGDGLRPIVKDLEPVIYAAMLEAINDYNFTAINKFPSIPISNGLIDGLRSMNQAERSIFMDRLVSEMAFNEVNGRVSLIRQMLLIGLNAPDIVASQAASDTSDFVRSTTLPDLDALVQEIYSDLALKKSTVNSTALTIINQNNARQVQGVSAEPGAVNETPYMIDGGTKD